jgi:hypothetical protein
MLLPGYLAVACLEAYFYVMRNALIMYAPLARHMEGPHPASARRSGGSLAHVLGSRTDRLHSRVDAKLPELRFRARLTEKASELRLALA